jgi:hypothetical protein
MDGSVVCEWNGTFIIIYYMYNFMVMRHAIIITSVPAGVKNSYCSEICKILEFHSFVSNCSLGLCSCDLHIKEYCPLVCDAV